MTITQQIAEQVLPALATAVGTLITAAAPFVVHALVKRLSAATKNERLKGALERLGDAADKAVRDVSATVATSLKDGAADGKFSPEERDRLKGAAIAKVREYIGRVGMKDVCTTLGYATPEEMTHALETEIENAVFAMKLQKEAVKAAAPVVQIKP